VTKTTKTSERLVEHGDVDRIWRRITGQAVSAKFQTAESSTTGGFEGPSHVLLGAVASSNLAQG